MSIDEQASSDLNLNDGDAENVVGGAKKKHKKPKHPGPATHQVTYIKVPGPPANSVETIAGPAIEDCTDDPYASDPPVN